MNFDIIVIGSGPGGYVAAIRASQLGKKVAIVERESLGGICLNWGCIPTKALLKSAQVFNYINHAEDYGIKIEKATADFGAMIGRSRGVADAMSKGVQFLLKKNKIEVISDVVLSAAGVSPNTENIGLETLGIKTEKGMILVGDYYETNVPGIYAIGDVIPGPALAHVASAEGITCVEKIAGHSPEPIDYNNIPGCTYCIPEVASVGYTEQAAKDAGYKLKVGKFPFSASGKAKAGGVPQGFVKVIFDEKYGEFLGAHMIGNNVTEMIAEVVAARKLETTGHEIIKTIHPHPTMSEAVMEAAAAAYDEVIHL
ncbi:UNVERIFIED_CONTAM: hypothetical protein GTU68_028602 [Idotea baltica]|nr:hypothetical protein [Idotea baltica]